MAVVTVTFSRIDSEPKQEAGSLASRVIALTFQVDAADTTVSLLPRTASQDADGSVAGTVAKPNMMRTAGLSSVSRVEVVEAVHRSSVLTTVIRSWCDVSSGMPGTLYLGSAPTNSVDYVCKLRVYGKG